MIRRLTVLGLVVGAMLLLASGAEARHPHCGVRYGGFGGYGGGFYSNTCYSGFNKYGWGGNCFSFSTGCNPCFQSYNYCGPSYYCAPRVYTSYYYNGCYAPYGYNTFYSGGYYPQGIYYSPRFGVAAPPAGAPAPVAARVAVAKPKIRATNVEYRRKGEQYLAQADSLFREQKYQQAIERYKLASETAPDLAEAFWHKGHAYVATNRYELAAASFKRALAINPRVDRNGFSLAKLYGTTTIAKTGHLETLAAYALEHSDSADAFFLLGVFLKYDGEPDRAAPFFARAAELSRGESAHLAGFLPLPEDSKPVVVPVSRDELEI